jgi:hypothetical protein
MTKISKTTADMRKFLVDQMYGVAAGTVDIGRAKATANLAQQVCNTFNVEIKMADSDRKNGKAAKALKL